MLTIIDIFSYMVYKIYCLFLSCSDSVDIFKKTLKDINHKQGIRGTIRNFVCCFICINIPLFL